MMLEIYSETKISFDIEYKDVRFVLRLNGGTWELLKDGATSYVAQGRVDWTTALSRALAIIAQEIDKAEMADD